MASSRCPWIAFIFISVMTSDTGVFGRAVDMKRLLSQSPNAEELYKPLLRADASRLWKREITDTPRTRCAELAAPWHETTRPPQDTAKLFRLRVRPFSPGDSRSIVFPGKSLFSFVRRVYHCCQAGRHCRNVKGIQGHLSEGTDVEFLLTRDVLSVAVMRAELHLQLFNPQRLYVQPVLPSMAKRNLPTRYSLWSQGDTVELRVDLLLLFQGLQEAAGGAGGGSSLVNMRRAGVLSGGGPRERPALQSLQDTEGDLWGEGLSRLVTALDLGLALTCSKGRLLVSCEHNGVHLLHAPFIALSY